MKPNKALEGKTRESNQLHVAAVITISYNGTRLLQFQLSSNKYELSNY
jgi:hypothetical protein